MTSNLHTRSSRRFVERSFPYLLSVALLTMAACDRHAATLLEADPPPAASDAAGWAVHSGPERTGGQVSNNVVLLWGEACLQSIRDAKHGPPMTARTLAVVHTAMYDAWAAYDAAALGTTLGNGLRRPAQEHTLENKEKAVSYAAYRALVDLFPDRTPVFDGLMASLGYDPANTTTDVTTPAGVGNVAAAALVDFRRDDGANQHGGYADYTGYRPVNPPLDPTRPGVGTLVDPMKWQPLIHTIDGEKVTQTWIIPHWRHVTPFALTSADQFLPPPPADIKSGEFRRQVEELIRIQARLTDE